MLIPPVISGCNWRLKLFHAKSYGRGRDLMRSAQLYPFFDISTTCAPPPNVGLQCTPSIKDVSSFLNVGIGAEVPSGSGTLKWDGAVDPSGIAMRAVGIGSDPIVLIFALPLSNQYERK